MTGHSQGKARRSERVRGRLAQTVNVPQEEYA
jgi:hypothetical protein